jgi:hypothetical protein
MAAAARELGGRAVAIGTREGDQGGAADEVGGCSRRRAVCWAAG